MKIQSLGYILVETENLSAWDHYGQEVCGFMKHPDFSDEEKLCLKIDHEPFRFLVQNGPEEKFILAGLELEDASALNDAKKIFDELNINYQQLSADDLFTRQITDGISFNDPAGNLIELYHGRLNDETKFTSPKGISGFVTKDLGFGHVVYAALNIEETHDFYTNVLGFGDSDIMNLQMSPNPEDPKMKLYFMHCDNKRHHTVAIMQSPTPPSGLVHTMVEVKTIDEVGEALDRAINNGIHISSSLGRHMNDKMVSFYMQTPGGFDLEFGYDGDQPDWSKHQTTSSPAPSYWGHVFTPPPEK